MDSAFGRGGSWLPMLVDPIINGGIGLSGAFLWSSCTLVDCIMLVWRADNYQRMWERKFVWGPVRLLHGPHAAEEIGRTTSPPLV